MSLRCDNCPLNGNPDWRNVTCVAVARSHPPYCWAMDPTHSQRNPSFGPLIIKKSLELLDPKPVKTAPCSSCSGTPLNIATKATAAVVVISHNYGRFLREAIQSVLEQRRPPTEILVVDDSSTDETAHIAAWFADRNVRYLRGTWRHVHRAREAGYRATTASVLCFLDADDRLPPDYLAVGLPLFNNRQVGLVYSDYQHFGDQSDRVTFPPFSRDQLAGQNFMHAGSLVRREALRLTDAFAGPDPAPAFADWHLWKRVVHAGFTAAKSSAVYQYRKHGASMMATAPVLPYYDQAGLAHEAVTIFVPLSGRKGTWNTVTRPWLERQTWPRAQCRLVLCDTSQDAGFSQDVRNWLAASDYTDGHYYCQPVGEPGLADQNRVQAADAVRTAMKRIYSRMARNIDTPFVLTLEDDVRPGLAVIDRLLHGLTPEVSAIAAPYRSRFSDHCMVWDHVGTPLKHGAGLQDVGGTGFGCTLFRRELLAGELFVAEPGESDDYDINFAHRVRDKGKRWRVDWESPAEHVDATKVEVIREPATVSVVVAAHNNGPFLRDALASALNQSHKPIEVFYADDGSTDNSLAIAREFPGVQVLALPRGGACATRNAACRRARGTYLLPLDGDDILPRNYIESRVALARTSSSTAFVYGAAQAFGGDWNYYWTAPDWNPVRLWNGNYVNTSTLFRRDAFEKVGRWREIIGTAWDWDLALRLAKAGYKGVSDPNSFLLYRHHTTSHSHEAGFKEHVATERTTRMKLLVRSLHCRLKIVSIVSGRLPELFPTWLNAVQENVQQRHNSLSQEPLYAPWGSLTIPEPHLELLYTGPEAGFATLQQQADALPASWQVSLTFAPWTNQYSTERERRDNVARFLAQRYNQALGEEELVWFLEDDVIPPPHALDRLTREVLGSDTPAYAATGAYRNRHKPDELVASRWDGQNPQTIHTLKELPQRSAYVDMTGTGCLLVFRPFAAHAFESHYRDIPAHDWRWCLDLKNYREDWHPAEKRALLLPDVVCRHHRTANDWV